MNLGRRITHAATVGDVATICEVLDEAPDLTTASTLEGWMPLHLAARQGQAEAVAVLLGYGADANLPVGNSMASTPLLEAIRGIPGEVDATRRRVVVMLLLAQGADVNLPNTAGATPLHKAAIAGATDVVQLLLACGANVAAVAAHNSGRQTALEHAQDGGHQDIAALLVRAAVAPVGAGDIRRAPKPDAH